MADSKPFASISWTVPPFVLPATVLVSVLAAPATPPAPPVPPPPEPPSRVAYARVLKPLPETGPTVARPPAPPVYPAPPYAVTVPLSDVEVVSANVRVELPAPPRPAAPPALQPSVPPVAVWFRRM